MLKILKLVTLMQAFEQSKWQEESNLALVRRNKMVTRSMVPVSTSRLTNSQPLKSYNPVKNEAA
jgi:hypothetical protein